MKKELLIILCIGILLAAPACSVRKKQTEKIKDLDFSVVREEEIPKELLKEIEKKGMEEFRLTYLDQGKLYIARGYGEKETTGYTVQVASCYETEGFIWFRTELLGPAKNEKVRKEGNNPYVVIQLNGMEKNVVFE